MTHMFSCFQELDLGCDTGNAQMAVLLFGATQTMNFMKKSRDLGDRLKAQHRNTLGCPAAYRLCPFKHGKASLSGVLVIL